MGFYCLREDKKVFGCLQINVLYSHRMLSLCLEKKAGAYFEDILDLEPLKGRFTGKQKGSLIKFKLPYKRTRVD